MPNNNLEGKNHRTPEQKEADAAAMRERYRAKDSAARSERAKARLAAQNIAKSGADLASLSPLTRRFTETVAARAERDPEFAEAIAAESVPETHESSAPLVLAARTEANVSEKMKDHLQRASALGASVRKERNALGKGIREGKTYNSAAELVRKFIEDGRKGAVNAKGQTRLIQMIENMVHVATSGSPRAVHAFEALMARAYGKPKPSDESLDALSKGGVQLIYVAPPELPESHQKQFNPKPDFIEGEFSDD